MTIQQTAAPSQKTGIGAVLYKEPERGSNDFASTLRDSFDRSADRQYAAEDSRSTTNSTASSTAARKRSQNDKDQAADNRADGTGAQKAEAPPPPSSDSARDGKASGSESSEAVSEVNRETASSSAAECGNSESRESSAMLFSNDLPHLASLLRSLGGMAGSKTEASAVQTGQTGDGLPVGGKETPPGLQLKMESGITSPFVFDGTAGTDAALPGFSDTNLLADIPLLKGGTEQTGPNPLPNMPGALLSTLNGPRDTRAMNADAATTANLLLQSHAEAGSDAWLDDFGTKIQWLQNMKVSTADLSLHPAELGNVEIRIVTEDNNIKVTIVTQTSAARDIIETTLPRLRDMLASQGMELDQGSVSQQSAQDRKGEHGTGSASGVDNGDDTPVEVSPRLQTRLLAEGQIDHYV